MKIDSGDLRLVSSRRIEALHSGLAKRANWNRRPGWVSWVGAGFDPGDVDAEQGGNRRRLVTGTVAEGDAGDPFDRTDLDLDAGLIGSASTGTGEPAANVSITGQMVLQNDGRFPSDHTGRWRRHHHQHQWPCAR